MKPGERREAEMTVGEKIRARRIELGMTMDDLGKAIGVQRSAINKYEKGLITDLKRSTIAALANALNVSVFYLLDDDPNDEDQQRLEALHQNPQLGLLFDRSRKMSHEDVEFMLQMADRILKERDGG
jgi:transcriptional regulator with XRE-family HTH domain